MFDTSQPLAKTATFDIYVVAATKTAGTKEIVHPETDQPIFLTTPAILTAADVATVRNSTNPNGYAVLNVSLTPAGGKKMAAATANPAGTKLALVINDNLLSAVTVKHQISENFEVNHALGPEENEKFFRSLTEE